MASICLGLNELTLYIPRLVQGWFIDMGQYTYALDT